MFLLNLQFEHTVSNKMVYDGRMNGLADPLIEMQGRMGWRADGRLGA